MPDISFLERRFASAKPPPLWLCEVLNRFANAIVPSASSFPVSSPVGDKGSKTNLPSRADLSPRPAPRRWFFFRINAFHESGANCVVNFLVVSRQAVPSPR